MRIKKYLILLFLIFHFSSQAQVFEFIKDLYPGISDCGKGNSIVYNGKLYFGANITSSTSGLWQSNGTPSGTILLKAINFPLSFPQSFTVFNGKLYFTADDGTHGRELWVSDGSAIGTYMLIDIYLGSQSSYPIDIYVYQNKMYFSADDGVNGKELWVSDGTATGTTLLLNINVNYDSNPNSFKEVNGKLYFTADDDIHGAEMWVSNGTAGGTHMVKDIYSGLDDSYANPAIVLNNKMYFAAKDVMYGTELWCSDGTDTGTHLVKNICVGSAGSFPGYFTLFNNHIYFLADSLGGQPRIYITDGTDTGTHEFDPAGTYTGIYNLLTYNNAFYFTAAISGFGPTLVKSDGTSAGCTNVLSSYYNFRRFTVFKNRLYFINDSITSDPSSTRFWVTDGTTIPAQNIPLPGDSTCTNVYQTEGFTEYDQKLFFNAHFDNHGFELWSFTDTVAALSAAEIKGNEFQIDIFPNPISNNSFTINGLEKGDYEIELKNEIGSTVYTNTYPSNGKVNVLLPCKPASGIYFVEVKKKSNNSSGVVVRRLVIR